MVVSKARLGIGGSRRQDAIRFCPGWQSNPGQFGEAVAQTDISAKRDIHEGTRKTTDRYESRLTLAVVAFLLLQGTWRAAGSLLTGKINIDAQDIQDYQDERLLRRVLTGEMIRRGVADARIRALQTP